MFVLLGGNKLSSAAALAAAATRGVIHCLCHDGNWSMVKENGSLYFPVVIED